MQDVSRKALKSLPWAALESGGVAVLALISTVVLARLLGPDEFGIAAVALALGAILEAVITAVISDAVVQRRPLSTLHVDSAFWAMTVVAIAGASILIAGAGFISHAYGEPRLASLLPVSGISCFFAAIGALPVALTIRRMRIRQLAIRTMWSRTLAMCVSVACAFAGLGALSLVAGGAVGNALAAITVWGLVRRRPRLRFSWPHFAQLLRFGLFPAAETLLWVLTTRIFIVVVGIYHSAAAIGLLNVAFRVVDTVGGLLNGVSSRIGLPLFSALRDDIARVQATFLKAIKLITMLAVPVFFIIAALAPTWVGALFGQRWEPAVPLIQILCIATALNFPRIIGASFLKALGKPQVNLALGVVGFLVALTVAFFSSWLTIEQTALGWASRVAVVVPLGIYFVYLASGVSTRDQIVRMLPALGAGAAVGMTCWGLQWIAGLMGVPSSLILVGGAVFFCATYALLIPLMDPEGVKLARGLWVKLRSSGA